MGSRRVGLGSPALLFYQYYRRLLGAHYLPEEFAHAAIFSRRNRGGLHLERSREEKHTAIHCVGAAVSSKRRIQLRTLRHLVHLESRRQRNSHRLAVRFGIQHHRIFPLLSREGILGG